SPSVVGPQGARRQARPAASLLERRVFLAVGLAVEPRGDEDLGRHLLALEVPGDHPGRLAADAVGVLDRVGVGLAVLDGLLALGLAVEPDDLDPVRPAGLLQGRTGA